MSEVSFTVPLVPPSVNHYVKHTRSGRHYVTKEAIAFKEAVHIFAAHLPEPAERYEVILHVYLGKGARGDADNFGKCALDALASAGVIHSDSAVDIFTVKKSRDRKRPRTEITVRTIQEV